MKDFLLFLVSFACVQGLPPHYKLTFPPGVNAYARLTASLPSDMTEFTICYWVKVHQMNSGHNTILSYAVLEDDNEIRFFFDTNTFGFYRKTGSIARTRIGLISIGKWYHICGMWSLWDGRWDVYVNGHHEGNGTEIGIGQKVIPAGLLMIGQDQDNIGGGFATKDALAGDVTDLNMWDEVLPERWVQNKYQCGELEGNILAWSQLQFVMYGGVVLAPTNLCEQDRRVQKMDVWSTL